MTAWASDEFVDWVDALFGHPVAEPAWYFGEAFDQFWEPHELTPARTVARLTQLFVDPSPLLGRYSREQLAQGIWFLVGESSPGRLCHSLIDDAVDLDARVQCIRQIYTLFRDFFGVGCDGPSIENSDPLHMACYMWWDIFPSWGLRACRGPAIDGACLEVMVATLELRVEVCQIAALHGLNHWYLHHGSEVERVIDAFLASNVPLTSHVREYAKVARRGGSQ